jgi:hypothetical protein
MNTTAILSIIALFFAIVVIVILVAIKILSVKNSILTDRNKIYQEFIKRTSVKKFITILDNVGDRAVDSDIKLMLQKYFELVLCKIDSKKIPNLLIDLEQSKHSGVLMECLRQAVAKDDGLFGIALANNIDNFKNKLVIQDFISNLPPEQQTKQYQAALNVVKEDYNRNLIDQPSEYRKPVEEAIKEFQKKIIV